MKHVDKIVWLAVVLSVLFLIAPAAEGATPTLRVPDSPLSVAGARVPPNLLLDLSLTFVDAGAAYRDEYNGAISYDGYFNPRFCYRYPNAPKAAGASVPSLDERTAYFMIAGQATAAHTCGATAFSGNFLNWATASVLDLLRLGLTGGDRVIDESALTVLQRAWLPDGAYHPDFYAHPTYFPRKVVVPVGVLPFDADKVYIVSCRNRVLFSNTRKGSSCDAARAGASGRRLVSDKYFGEYLVRVQVCTAADATSRPALCEKMAGGGYKPQGALQAASGRVRIGVMSYLTEHGAGDPNLYGGVLRAPLAFIGDSAADAPEFTPVPNHHAEWNLDTGVLARASGSIAYINQLGRSNPSRPGAYKTADPGAELFYESLRYLQGLPGDAGIATDDGMPVWNTRPDPLVAACQRNVIAVIGHPAFSEDRYLPGNTRADHLDRARLGGGALNIMQQTRRVGEFEAGIGKDGISNPAPRPELRALDLLDDGVGGAGSFYLPGAAYWAHTTTIRSDKAVRVDSYALELGTPTRAGASALYLAAKYGGFEDRNRDANPYVSVAGHGATSEWSVDGATPATYFAAADPLRLADNARAFIAAAAGRRGNLRGTAPASGRDAGGAFLLQSGYDQWHWSGSLQRLALNVGADGAARIDEAASWDAATVLDGDAAHKPIILPRPAPAARKIYTLADLPGRQTVTVPFNWDGLPSSLRESIDGGDGLGAARVAYLRGERGRELGRADGVFRRRASALGDIVRSAPLLVGAPSAAVQDKAYGAFYARYRERRAAVYAGANDGMLHAFDAADGSELFAYVPRALQPALGRLSRPDYVHRAYVDGSPGQGEALIGGRWRSVLASGMGMGARGVFALDVSDPGAFADGMGALWEFTEKDDPAMGFVSAPPVIAKLRVGARGKAGEFRYFALVSSGVNNYGADVRRSDGGGALFMLALDKAADAPWRLGVNYYRVDMAIGDPGLANALAAPALALSTDGSVARAWAGDLQGTLWRVDLSTRPPWRATPLFAARDASGARQSITQAPRAVFAPGGGYLVLFGTGRLIDAGDVLTSAYSPQSFYAVLDRTASAADGPRQRSALAARQLSGATIYAVKGEPFSMTGPDAKQGWYFDFPNAREDGERLAASPVLAAGTVFIDSLMPGSDACAAPATRGYVLDALSGYAFGADGVAQSGASTGALAVGLPGATPVLFALATRAGARDGTGARMATRSYALLRAGADADAKAQTAVADVVKITLPGGRVSWREVANWQALHKAAQK